MRTLVFDIETAEDTAYTARDGFMDRLAESCEAPANYKDPVKIALEVARQVTLKKDRLCLSPRTGRIIAIACGWLDDEPVHVFDGPEPILLAGFLAWLRDDQDRRKVLAGFSVRDFDAPFIAVRAALLGLELPWWWPHARDYRYIADARDLLDDGKLDDWLHRFDLPAKTGSGDQAATMQPEQLRAYVANDVRVERLLLRRLEGALPAIRDNRHTA